MKQLGEENRKLKQLVGELSLDKHILQDVPAKKPWRLDGGRRLRALTGVDAFPREALGIDVDRDRWAFENGATLDLSRPD